jgi:tripartite-type tricarboxylate transporter receptor subunit TctC
MQPPEPIEPPHCGQRSMSNTRFSNRAQLMRAEAPVAESVRYLPREHPSTVLPHIRPGRLIALALGSKKRSALVPEYATIDEAGMPGYESSTTFGVLAPAKTQSAVIDRLNQKFVKILENPDIKERLSVQGLESAGSTPQQYAAHLKVELTNYGRIVKAAGIKIE